MKANHMAELVCVADRGSLWLKDTISAGSTAQEYCVLLLEALLSATHHFRQ